MVMKSTLKGHFASRPLLGQRQKNLDKVAVKKDPNPSTEKKPANNYGVGGFKGRLG